MGLSHTKALLVKHDPDQVSQVVFIILWAENRCDMSEALLSVVSAVPAALNETLPVTSKRVEAELSASQSLAWKYTAALEKPSEPDGQRGGSEPPAVLVRQALYNVRQHEVYLKKLLVRRASSSLLKFNSGWH